MALQSRQPQRTHEFYVFPQKEIIVGFTGTLLTGCLGIRISKKKENLKKAFSQAWALHLLSLVVIEAADLFTDPLFPSGSDVSEVSCSSDIKLWIPQSFLYGGGVGRAQIYLHKIL